MPSLRRAALVALIVVAVLEAPVSVVAVSSKTAPASRPDSADLAVPLVEELRIERGESDLYGALDDIESVREARSVGALTEPEPLLPGQTLVVSFRSPSLNRTVARTEGANTTARFFRALNRTDAEFEITAERGPECPPARFDLAESRTRVLRNDSEARFAVVTDTDRLRVRGGCRDPPRIEGNYDVSVTGADGVSTAEGFLPLRVPPSAENSILVRRGAPSVAADLTNATAIRRAVDAGRLVDGERAVHGETVVLTFQSAGLNRSYDRTSGANATDRLLRAVNASNGSLRVTGSVDRLDRDGGGALPPGVQLRGPGVRTFRDRANATFHVTIDSRVARVRGPDGITAMANSSADSYLARVVVPGEQPSVIDGRFGLVEPRGDVIAVGEDGAERASAGRVVVVNRSTFLVRGSTNLAPESNLTLRAVGPDGPLATRRVTVGVSSTAARERNSFDFAQSFDVPALSTGDPVTLELRRGGTLFNQFSVIKGARPTLSNATAERVDNGSTQPMARFAVTARYPADGFVAVQTADGYVGYPVPADEPVRVNGTVRLRSAEQRSVRLIAVYDANRNGSFDGPEVDEYTDPPFQRERGELLQQDPVLAPPTPTPTVSPPPPGTTISSTGDGAGIGAVGAVFAVGLALLVRRL